MTTKKYKKEPIPAEERVPLKEKVAYGLGNVAMGVQEESERRVMTPVFVIEQGISPAVLSVAGVIYRIWDALTDLTMGWVSDNFRSRWGRRKPFMFVGAFLMAFVMPIVFMFNREWSVPAVAAWMICVNLMLYLTLTIYNIPYQSLLLEITPNSNERTNVTAIRGYLGMTVQFMMTWMWWFCQRPMFNNAAGEPDIINGARWTMAGLAVLVLVLGLLPAIFVKERFYHKVEEQDERDKQQAGDTKKGKFWHNLKLTFQNKPFMLLMIFTLCFTIGVNLKWGLDFYTKLYYVCNGDRQLASTIQGVQGTLQVLLSMVGISTFQWIANRWGKITSLVITMSIVLFASVSTLFCYTPKLPYLSMLPVLLLGPVITAIWVLIPSMTGDIVDYDELHTNERREGAFASIFSWGLKISNSFASMLSGFVVVWAGYEVSKHKLSVPPDILFRMRMLLAFVPVIFIVPGIIVAAKFPLNTRRVKEIKQTLEERRGKL